MQEKDDGKRRKEDEDKKKAEGNSANGMSCVIGKEADKGNKNEYEIK